MLRRSGQPQTGGVGGHTSYVGPADGFATAIAAGDGDDAAMLTDLDLDLDLAALEARRSTAA